MSASRVPMPHLSYSEVQHMFSDLPAGPHSRVAATLKSIVTKSLLSLHRSEVLLVACMLSKLSVNHCRVRPSGLVDAASFGG